MIKNLESQTLTFDQLKEMVGKNKSKNIKWILYDDLINYKSLAMLFKIYKAIVILLEIESPRAPRVGHFVVLLDHGNHYEHFDSYGLTIDQENIVTEEKHLTNLFKNSEKPIVENTKQMQRFREDIQTCGRWVVARLLLSGLELNDFIKLISSIAAPNDETVTLLTMLLPYKA